MKKILLLIFLLCCLLLSAALAEDLTGTWGFAGGGEIHGDGFTLRADGTGVWLEGVNYDIFPLHDFTVTENTFLWQTAQEGDGLYLLETYPDGKQYKWKIEPCEDGRIHIPEGDGGGFYFRVQDDALRAYLDLKKGEMAAFDLLLEDYLTGELWQRFPAGMFIDGAVVLNQDGMWQLVMTGYLQEEYVAFRFCISMCEIYVREDQYVSLWEGNADSQLWTYPETKDNYQMLAGVLESYLEWEYPGLEDAKKENRPLNALDRLKRLQAETGVFPKGKTYDVYQGPGEAYGRSGGGKGKVSTNGDIHVFGTWKDYLLIEYDISKNKHRIGWIALDQLSSYQAGDYEELQFAKDGWEYICGVLTQDVKLTDDPFFSQNAVAKLEKGTSVHVLAKMDQYLLIEGFEGRKLMMGFAPVANVDLEHGYAEDTVYHVDRVKTYVDADIYPAMEAVEEFIRAGRPGTAVEALYYVEADNADPTAWWQPEADETCRHMRLYADLNDIAMYDYEIAAYGIAKDYIFILCCEEGGNWQVINFGYE